MSRPDTRRPLPLQLLTAIIIQLEQLGREIRPFFYCAIYPSTQLRSMGWLDLLGGWCIEHQYGANKNKIPKISPWNVSSSSNFFLYLDGMLYSCVDGSLVHYINQRRPISVCKKYFLVNTISVDFISQPSSFQVKMELQLLQSNVRPPDPSTLLCYISLLSGLWNMQQKSSSWAFNYPDPRYMVYGKLYTTQ